MQMSSDKTWVIRNIVSSLHRHTKSNTSTQKNAYVRPAASRGYLSRDMKSGGVQEITRGLDNVVARKEKGRGFFVVEAIISGM